MSPIACVLPPQREAPWLRLCAALTACSLAAPVTMAWLLSNGAPVSMGREPKVTSAGDYRFFAGWRSDPFFFDAMGALNGFKFTGNDYFADKNVASIVLEVPNSKLGSANLRLVGPNRGRRVRKLGAGRPRLARLTGTLPCRRRETCVYHGRAGERRTLHPRLRTFTAACWWIHAAGSNAGRRHPAARRAALPARSRSIVPDQWPGAYRRR